ncbi:hypothetical protein OAS39_05590 [Pirellulales bacterium]|nr:hypothetical protein [Pirellulales bacterium]
MAEDPGSQSFDTPSAEGTSTPPEKKGSRRQAVLIFALLLLVGGLVYDRNVARPRSQQAYDRALEMVDESVMTSAGGEPLTNEAVHVAFGKKPSNRIETEEYTIETFRWRRGLLVLSYDVNVVYALDDEGRRVLHSAHLNKLPEESQLPGYEYPPLTPPPGELK